MRPNIFLSPKSHADEDHFSQGLAYILNLLPALGRDFAERIAILAGMRHNYFGDYHGCEFIALEFLEGAQASRPDLRLECARGEIFFENKLDAPLNLKQVQKHARLLSETKRSHLVFVSNTNHPCPALRSIRGYLHPKDRDHYLWLDLLPALDGRYRGGSHAAQLLRDFREALKQRGMEGRPIRGAKGSLYAPGSEAATLALNQLDELLTDLGFCVGHKKGEGTLRVYPRKYGKYPLLNPVFQASAVWLDPNLNFDVLVITVLSRNRVKGLDAALSRYQSGGACAFIADKFKSENSYTYHGHFVLPVMFENHPDGSTIRFAALDAPLRGIFKLLNDF